MTMVILVPYVVFVILCFKYVMFNVYVLKIVFSQYM